MFWRELILLFVTTVVSVHLLPVGPPASGVVHAIVGGDPQGGHHFHNAAGTGSKKYQEVTQHKTIHKRNVEESSLDNNPYDNGEEEDTDLHTANRHWKVLEYHKRSFNPWGGKRSEKETLDAPARRGFQPWGGKRQVGGLERPSWDDLEVSKPVQVRSFNPWGGKRSHDGYHEFAEDEEEDEDVEKRGFQPWGGKRAVEMMVPLAAPAVHYKRRFQPWGGKRQYPNMDELKRRFNPWAGKRSAPIPLDAIAEREDDDDDVMDAADDIEEHKRRFQPWGGKRSSFQPWGGKRSSFQPWGGKRGSFQPWGGKRASFQPWGGKRGFNPWGGKRDGDSDFGKRAAFQPWAGKRSSEPDHGDMDDLMAKLHKEGTLN